MPAATVLTLKSGRVPQALHVRGWVYHLLARYREDVHDGEGPRPFSLALGKENGLTWVRVAFLDDDLAASFAEAVWSLRPKVLPLRSGTAKIESILELSHPLAGKTTWGEILNTKPRTDLQLEFLSPTFFRRRGFNYPVPEPALTLYSLAQKWSAFAPEPVPDEALETLIEHATVRYLRGKTIYAQAHEQTAGFVGQIAYHLHGAGNEAALWLGRLGGMAFYSGVGAKTTLGFGLVREYQRQPKRSGNGQAEA